MIFIFILSNELLCIMEDMQEDIFDDELDMWLLTTPNLQTPDEYTLTLAPTSVFPLKPIPVSIPALAPGTIREPNDGTKKSISRKSIQYKPIIMSKKRMTLEEKKREKTREMNRIKAQRNRDRRKAEFLSSIKYSELLQKQNQTLKKQICTLKQQLNKLIIRCKHQQAARIKF